MQLDPERGYDLIGDIHGCGHALARLLDQLGYHLQGGVWRHPRRQVIFLGDIIDRGPHIREALHLVYDMVDRGQAYCIMGNHEFNALGWYMPAPPGSGRDFVREHSPRFARLLQETFQQFEPYPEEWKAFRDWFYGLPLFLETERFRVVHACWDSRVIARLRPFLNDACINPAILHEAGLPGTFICQALDRLLRGTDMPLPEGMTLTSEEGFVRTFFRTSSGKRTRKPTVMSCSSPTVCRITRRACPCRNSRRAACSSTARTSRCCSSVTTGVVAVRDRFATIWPVWTTAR